MTDNCKLNFHIQIHTYSMYTVGVMRRYILHAQFEYTCTVCMCHDEIHPQNWDMHKHLCHLAWVDQKHRHALYHIKRVLAEQFIQTANYYKKRADGITR